MKRAVLVLLASFLTYGCAKAEKPLHPDFSLVGSVFRKMAARMPAETARLALEDPAAFLAAMKDVLAVPADVLVLVDKTHGLARDAEPADLVRLERYPSLRCNRKDFRMRRTAAEALVAMSDSARKAGIALIVASAFRPYDYQTTLFDWNLKTYGREVTEREIAPPGRSQHQLGTVVDFDPTDANFHGTPAALWLEKNAADFGFSLSYPREREAETGYVWESWHYRYVGTAAVRMIRRFFDGHQQAFLAWFASQGDAFRTTLRSR